MNFECTGDLYISKLNKENWEKISQDSKRKFFLYVSSGMSCNEIDIKDIKNGDTFIVYESDGTPVLNKGEDSMTAKSDAFINDQGIWGVQV